MVGWGSYNLAQPAIPTFLTLAVARIGFRGIFEGSRTRESTVNRLIRQFTEGITRNEPRGLFFIGKSQKIFTFKYPLYWCIQYSHQDHQYANANAGQSKNTLQQSTLPKFHRIATPTATPVDTIKNIDISIPHAPLCFHIEQKINQLLNPSSFQSNILHLPTSFPPLTIVSDSCQGIMWSANRSVTICPHAISISREKC